MRLFLYNSAPRITGLHAKTISSTIKSSFAFFFLVMKKKSGEVFGLPFRVCALCDLSKVLRENFCPKCFLSCVVVILSFIVSKHGFKGRFRLSSSVLSYVTLVYS